MWGRGKEWECGVRNERRGVGPGAKVALVPAGGDARSGADIGDDGALVVLAVDTTTAARLAHAAVTARLSVVLRGG